MVVQVAELYGATVLGGDVRTYTGDGSTTGYTVTSGADVENVLVFLNGVYQRPTTDYTVLEQLLPLAQLL